MNREADGIKPVSPVSPVNPANGYNAYQNQYLDNGKRNRDQNPKKKHDQSNQDGDYFEKSDGGDAEYLYNPDGTFMETKSNMKRLIKKESESNSSPITDRTKGDVRTCLPGTPLYVIDDNSYSNYVNQNPNNKYIMKMKGELPPEPDILTLEEYNRKYFEEDGFTMRSRPLAAGLEKRLVRKADGDSSSSSSSSDSGSSCCDPGTSVSDGYGCGISPSSPSVPYYSKEYLKERERLMDVQQKQRSPQDLKNDKKKPFQEVLKDQLRMFFD